MIGDFVSRHTGNQLDTTIDNAHTHNNILLLNSITEQPLPLSHNTDNIAHSLLFAKKQDTLTAGTNISIVNNTISATFKSQVVPEPPNMGTYVLMSVSGVLSWVQYEAGQLLAVHDSTDTPVADNSGAGVFVEGK